TLWLRVCLRHPVGRLQRRLAGCRCVGPRCILGHLHHGGGKRRASQPGCYACLFARAASGTRHDCREVAAVCGGPNGWRHPGWSDEPSHLRRDHCGFRT
ncbi:glpF, partial [Symbiodinium pilosum]